jgi:hypothetical protein
MNMEYNHRGTEATLVYLNRSADKAFSKRYFQMKLIVLYRPRYQARLCALCALYVSKTKFIRFNVSSIVAAFEA